MTAGMTKGKTNWHQVLEMGCGDEATTNMNETPMCDSNGHIAMKIGVGSGQ